MLNVHVLSSVIPLNETSRVDRGYPQLCQANIRGNKIQCQLSNVYIANIMHIP